jgi:hypothetical protein
MITSLTLFLFLDAIILGPLSLFLDSIILGPLSLFLDAVILGPLSSVSLYCNFHNIMVIGDLNLCIVRLLARLQLCHTGNKG